MLLKELQSLALDVKVLTENNDELIIRELDEDDEAIPTAAARDAEERDKQTAVEEYDISGGDDEEEDIDLGSIFETDDDEDDFNGKELFGGDGEDDDFDDDDLGDKFSLFDENDDDDDDDDDDDGDIFGDDEDGKDE